MGRPLARPLACSFGVLASVGCGATSGGSGLFSSESGTDGGSTGSSAGSTRGDLIGDGSVGAGGCSDQASDYVYVLSLENDLYRFAPAAKEFTKIGTLGCNTPLQPNAMAVDRNAVAYVNYVAPDDSTGAIFQVSTENASCTGPVAILPAGWERLGMGYSTNGASASAEALYVAAVGGPEGLGVLELGTGTLEAIGPFTGHLTGQNADLTGTGDGRLFGFFATNPVEVAEIDKTSGATAPPVEITAVPMPLAWSFSFWGGHFYLYTSQEDGSGSDVADYDPVSGRVDVSYMQGIGFDIVGAGVSTCAPVNPPQ
jgi:hypothetical protein